MVQPHHLAMVSLGVSIFIPTAPMYSRSATLPVLRVSGVDRGLVTWAKLLAEIVFFVVAACRYCQGVSLPMELMGSAPVVTSGQSAVPRLLWSSRRCAACCRSSPRYGRTLRPLFQFVQLRCGCRPAKCGMVWLRQVVSSVRRHNIFRLSRCL